MSKYFNAYNKIVNLLKGPKTSPTITSVKPSTKITLEGEKKKNLVKAKSDVQKKYGGVTNKIMDETRQIRQQLQGMRGERITQSGISKGKDVTPGIYLPKKKKDK